MINKMRSYGIYLAWIISLVGSLLSLYFSELQHLEACRLCWFQRVALFPLAIQLGIGAYRSDFSIKLYALPLCFIGFAAALLQTLQQWLGFTGLCGHGTGSCAEKMVHVFNMIPFSWLSMVGFFLIAVFLFAADQKDHK